MKTYFTIRCTIDPADALPHALESDDPDLANGKTVFEDYAGASYALHTQHERRIAILERHLQHYRSIQQQ